MGGGPIRSVIQGCKIARTVFVNRVFSAGLCKNLTRCCEKDVMLKGYGTGDYFSVLNFF